MTFEEFWEEYARTAETTTKPFIAKAAWSASRQAAIEEAARIADAHNENHCENRDTTYRNCGTAIATGIRDLARPEADCSGCGKVDGEMHNYDCPEAQD